MIYKGLHTYHHCNTLPFQPVTQALAKGSLEKVICQNISSLGFDRACAEIAEALSLTALFTDFRSLPDTNEFGIIKQL